MNQNYLKADAPLCKNKDYISLKIDIILKIFAGIYILLDLLWKNHLNLQDCVAWAF